MNFDFLPKRANFYDPNEILRMKTEVDDAEDDAEEAEDDGGDVEDASPEGKDTGVIPGVEQPTSTIPNDGTSDVPPA